MNIRFEVEFCWNGESVDRQPFIISASKWQLNGFEDESCHTYPKWIILSTGNDVAKSICIHSLDINIGWKMQTFRINLKASSCSILVDNRILIHSMCHSTRVCIQCSAMEMKSDIREHLARMHRMSMCLKKRRRSNINGTVYAQKFMEIAEKCSE